MKSPPVKLVVIEIPFTPPSVNHYKKPVTLRTRNGPQKSFALTAEAMAFLDAVHILSRGQTLVPSTAAAKEQIRYALTATVFLGKNERGDADNFWKCIADGLVRAGVIHSDARVRSWHIEVEDGQRDRPRTLICASVMERGLTLAEQLQQGEKNHG